MSILIKHNQLTPAGLFWYSLVIAVLIVYVQSASAQFVPLPPPSPSTSSSSTTEQSELSPEDRKPPIVEVLTSSMKEGKNVFKVKITDESGIQLGQVKYVQNGQIKTIDLVKDLNDVYKGLVDIKPPSKVIVIEAGDPNGNIVTVVKDVTISPASNIFQDIQDLFSRIISRK